MSEATEATPQTVMRLGTVPAADAEYVVDLLGSRASAFRRHLTQRSTSRGVFLTYVGPSWLAAVRASMFVEAWQDCRRYSKRTGVTS